MLLRSIIYAQSAQTKSSIESTEPKNASKISDNSAWMRKSSAQKLKF